MWRALWPGVLILTIHMILFSFTTATSDYGYERKIIDEESGETIGLCTNVELHLLVIIYIVEFIPPCLTVIISFKTIGVDDLYSEAKWVLLCVLVQLQVFFVGVPLVLILQEVDANGRYIGQTLIRWSSLLIIIGFIFLPKMLTVRHMQRKSSKSSTTRDTATTSEDNPTNNPARDAAVGDRASPWAQQQQQNNFPETPANRIQIVTFD